MAEKEVRKTTAKKPSRKTAPKKAATKSVSTGKTPRKTTPRKKDTQKTQTRKAPTPIASTKKVEKKHTIILIAGVSFFLLVLGGSVFIGMSGSGEISIEGRIADVKEQASPEERTKMESIPVQNKSRLPDGGLVPSGVPDAPVPPPPPVASTTLDTASSTDVVATSTPEAVTPAEESTIFTSTSTNATDIASSTEGVI